MDHYDSMRIMEAIGKNHADLKQDLSDIRAEFSGFKGGAEERIKDLEDEVESTKKKQWILTYVVVPALGLFHSIANHFGAKV